MNNLTLGNDDFTYYETLGGGQGACPDADGPERRPRRDVQHAQHARSRRSSSSSRCARSSTRCGAARAAPARTRGGDGVVRELEALEEMRYSLITERRRHAPPGADGGEPGAPGRNLLNGEELPPKASGTLQPRRPAANRDPGRWGTWQTGLSRVAFFGLGIMGGPMAAQPGAGGLRVSVWTRTREKAERFAAEHGARAAADPRARRPQGADALDHDGARRARGRGGPVRRRRRGGGARRRARWSSTCRRSRRARRSAIAERLDGDGSTSSRRPCPAPAPRPRTARSRSWPAAADAAFERARPLFDVRWASASCTSARWGTRSWPSCSRT